MEGRVEGVGEGRVGGEMDEGEDGLGDGLGWEACHRSEGEGLLDRDNAFRVRVEEDNTAVIGISSRRWGGGRAAGGGGGQKGRRREENRGMQRRGGEGEG